MAWSCNSILCGILTFANPERLDNNINNTNAFFWNHLTPLFGKDESGKEKSRLKGVVVGVYNHVLPNIVVTAIYKCRLDLDRDV